MRWPVWAAAAGLGSWPLPADSLESRACSGSSPREGAPAPDAPRPVHEATRRSPSTAMIPPNRTPRSHARVGITPSACREHGYGTHQSRGRDVLSSRYATSPESSHTGYPTTKVPGQQGYWRSDGVRARRSPFHCGRGRRPRLRTTTHRRLHWSKPMWSPPPESNRRPHPYHGTTGNRCADRRLRRSHSTVGAEVIGSHSAEVCVHSSQY
jgi:hypothetical protein